ncbi:MAG: MBL fold metallo-hydrolase [Deltaproteobacteria bacterium]|nr:MAG: MBL fold metallo-hydrolase [Deltaproteobacteria bacterium]
MARLKAPVGGCTVRMYRHGLGDCFLLAFGVTKQRQKYVLIDCGVLLGTEEADRLMAEVARDIRQATGDHLDALVVTHEHWDHVSGFIQAKEHFDKIAVDQVWFAWTENPKNPLARELRERRQAALHGLRIALQNAAAAPPLFARRIESVSAFFGPDLGATGRATTEDAMDWVKQKWKNHRYCDPGGAPLQIDGLPDVKFYVLGPPTDSSYIRMSRTSSKGGQVYLDDAKTGQLGFFLAGLGSAPAVRQPFQEEMRFTPFNEAYHCDPLHPDVSVVANLYSQEAWRQIETDWTGAAGELALRLDAHTNNTSLVMAIELGPKDKVMLFAADAQVGNWLSWDTVTWSGEHKEITTVDLLSRTVFYKVGHHGSHNATLREKGLERMTNAELAAFVPVNRNMARQMRWRMPHEPLYERLKEKTLGRVVVSDAGLPVASSDAALESFRAQCSETELYTDYTVMRWKPRKIGR